MAMSPRAVNNGGSKSAFVASRDVPGVSGSMLTALWGVCTRQEKGLRASDRPERGPVTDSRAGNSALNALFMPSSVAVYGASAKDPERLGNVALRNCLQSRHALEVTVVHPTASEIEDREAVPSLDHPVDLAIVSVPASSVPEALRDASRAGTKCAIVLTSGFAEAGEAGQRLQQEALAAAGPMRIVGPNCMGVVSRWGQDWFNGSYFWSPPRQAGPISLVSQSGAFGGMFLASARERGLGLARFLSVGNEADLTESDVLEWLARDEDTGVIGMFVEGIKDGRRFVEALSVATSAKPVVVLKAAKSPLGSKAAASHTGSLAGSHGAFQAAIARCAALEVESSEEFFDALAVLEAEVERKPGLLPRSALRAERPSEQSFEQPGLLIVTVSGGPGVLAADEAFRQGLSLGRMSPGTAAALRRVVPDFAALGNPVDLTPQCPPEAYPEAMRHLLSDPAFDAAVLIDCGLDRPELAESFVDACRAAGKPATAFVVDVPRVAEHLGRAGVPLYPTPERAVAAHGVVFHLRSCSSEGFVAEGSLRDSGVDLALETTDPRPEVRSANANPPLGGDLLVLSEWDSKELLGPGIPRPREERVRSLGEALEAAERIGYPVFLKASGVAHKSDSGLVKKISDARELQEVIQRFLQAGDGSVILAEEVHGDLELVVGGLRDPQFGALVSVGLGGIAAEVLSDVSFLLYPFAPSELQGALDRLQGSKLLRGFRGLKSVDVESLLSILRAVGSLLERDQDVMEVDCNPVIVCEGEPVVVDALVARRLQ
jgi:acyl-CoA synthetase (NDP forming)